MSEKKIVVVRGGGDLASGVIHRLYRCGYRVLILESPHPSAIRRMVSFCEAIYEGEAFVEGVLSCKAQDLSQCEEIWERREIPILADPEGEAIGALRESGRLLAVVDAILAKKNLGTYQGMAPFTIALGPGFCAGEDADVVIETMRGHDLGKIIQEGWALPDTGVPGLVGGADKLRVIHSPAAGVLKSQSKIGDLVTEGQILAWVGESPVKATLSGVLRGLIHDGYPVFEGMKIADIDPRKEEKENCYTISDKARCIAGSVVEALLSQGILP